MGGSDSEVSPNVWCYRGVSRNHLRPLLDQGSNPFLHFAIFILSSIMKLKVARLSVSACGGLRKTGEWLAVASEAGNPFLKRGEQPQMTRSRIALT